MGAMTGVMGGMLRDVITARVPLVLRKEIYATAAITGIVVYLILQAMAVPEAVAFPTGVAIVIALRLIAIRWGLNLPSIPARSGPED